jgi:pimeloyl-ACP methyl ester carboxylesterase
MAPVPLLDLECSPLAGGRPVTISYERQGDGPALVFLHGGWGYDVYPVDIGSLVASHTVLIPTRSGYGASSPLDAFPPDFHQRAAEETLAVLDALGIERAVWWGHSDGAVVAAMAARSVPERVGGVIFEALHLFGDKPRSREFFVAMAQEPDSFSARIRATLEAEHGADRWRQILRLDGGAWLVLARDAPSPSSDLYGGRLSQISCPALIVHGGQDPRSEPGELQAILEALPDAQVCLLADAGHCPHAEATATAVTDAVLTFLATIER